MWRDYPKDYVEEAWKNSKRKIDFMEKIDITNRDYRACKRAVKFFDLKDEDFGANLKSEMRKPKKDLIGQIFGDLEVLSINEEKSKLYNRTYYNCMCNRCKNICIKRTDNLNSKTTDCGCKNLEKNRLKNITDITGNYYGSLEVIELDKEKTLSNDNINDHVYWKCKCHICGNIKSILGVSLKNGTSKTCGCAKSIKEHNKKLRKDMTGQTFGYLYFIEPDEEETLKHKNTNTNTSHLYWKCKCLNCGREVSINGYEARAGHVISCGCSRSSRGEVLIRNFLDNNNYKYKEQYSFSDLYGNNRPLKFDFALFNNENIFTLIEFQGEQHYVAKEFFGGEEQLKQQQEYDQKKRDYCKNNNIKLLEIPYTEIENIDTILSKELWR